MIDSPEPCILDFVLSVFVADFFCFLFPSSRPVETFVVDFVLFLFSSSWSRGDKILLTVVEICIQGSFVDFLSVLQCIVEICIQGSCVDLLSVLQCIDDTDVCDYCTLPPKIFKLRN